MKQTSVSLKQMVQFGTSPMPDTLFRGAQFILHELPIRLAHRVVELENLPHDLSKMPGVLTVKDCRWFLTRVHTIDTRITRICSKPTGNS
jgi:pyruvate dehydrogenase kinase 2/3/4